MLSRENRKLVLVAAACISVSLAAPAAAKAAKHVVNADKVDGFHAIRFNAPAGEREGRLVATNPTTGELPNNIIAQAPDAARLGGMAPGQLRFLNLDVMGGTAGGGAIHSVGTMDGSGIQVPKNGFFSDSFVIPPDYRAGDPIRLTLDVSTQNGGCDPQLYPDTMSVAQPGRAFEKETNSPAEGLDAPTGFTTVATPYALSPMVWSITSPDATGLSAGTAITFSIGRGGNDCSTYVFVHGMSVSY